MDLTTTAVAFGAAAALFGLSVWLDRRPYQPGRPWRFPSRLVMALTLLVMLVLGAHFVSLWTGQPFKGRTGF